METQDTIFPYCFYSLYLKRIREVDFTQREIDVIACLLNGRSSKTISSFLNVSPRTVETHVRNIMHKLECHSRGSIIDFIEKSDEYTAIKNYYSLLLNYEAFEKILIKALDKNRLCTLIHTSDLEAKEYYLVHQHTTRHFLIVA